MGTDPLTLSRGASAHGSEKLQRLTPASPPENANLTDSSQKVMLVPAEENAKLTLVSFAWWGAVVIKVISMGITRGYG